MATPKSILVTGATGAQGAAVVNAALEKGWKVRALVRSPERDDAMALRARGVELVEGSFDDAASLARASTDMYAVFSVQLAIGTPPGDEVTQAQRLIAAAKAANVQHMVHSSVSATGWRKGLSPDEASASRVYWDCKEAVEAAMRDASFAYVTILKPAFMMENFLLPKSTGMFPDLADRAIYMALPADVPLATIATRDIGAATMAAVEQPDKFDGADLELAGDALTIRTMAEVIGKAVDATIEVHSLPPADVIARGQYPGWVESQVWAGKVGYPARPEHQRAYGLSPTSFTEWAEQNRDALKASTARP